VPVAAEGGLLSRYPRRHLLASQLERRDAPSVPNCKFKLAKLKLQLTSAATDSRCHRARQDNPDKTMKTRQL
jgi:hypothetical protein